MQDYNTLLKNLRNILALRIKDEKLIIERLGNIIGKDYKTVWRRLRGEYKFSFDEIYNICTELGISMESLGDKNSASVSSLRVYQFPDPLSFDINKSHIGKMYSILENAVQSEKSAYLAICSRIPEFLHIKYDKLSQLLLLKLNYFTRSRLEPDFYATLNENWLLFSESNRYYQKLMNSFENMTFIWGPCIIENVVRDIRFFLDIEMITREDADNIKEELRQMMDWIGKMCECPADSPYKNFTFAVSPIDMNFHSNTISSAKGSTVFYSLYHLAFAYTENEEDVKSQEVITECLMKGATIISGNNHRERIRFMKTQYDEINKI